MNTYHVLNKEMCCVRIEADEFVVDENNNLVFYTDDEVVAMSNWTEWFHVVRVEIETIFKDDDLKDIM